MTRLKSIGIWALQLLLTIPMAGAGVAKFTSPAWERMFRRWGYPDNFYLLIGAIELVAGLALLVPRLASAAAIALIPVMIGAAATQITKGGRSGVGELVFAALLAVIAWARWPGVLAALAPRARARSAARSV